MQSTVQCVYTCYTGLASRASTTFSLTTGSVAVWQCGSTQHSTATTTTSPTITHHHRPHTVKEDHHSPSGRQSRQDNPVLSQSNLDIQQDMKCHLAFNIMTLSSVTTLKTSITSIIPTWLKSATTIYLTQTLKCWIHLNNFIY